MAVFILLATMWPAASVITSVRVGALFPMVKFQGTDSATLDQGGILRLTAFLLAVDEINNKTDGVADGLLPNTELRFVLRDSRRDPLVALVGALELVGSCSAGAPDSQEGIVAAVGAASSGPSESAAAAFERHMVPQISYSSTSAILSDGTAFPYFLRTPPSDVFQAEAMVDVLSNRFNYSAVALVSSTDSYGEGLKTAFYQLWTARNRTILTSQSIAEGGDYAVVYRELLRSRAHVIVLLCQASEGGRFLRGAYQAQPRIGGEGFLFFGSDAVATSDTWQKDNGAGGLSTDVGLRQQVLKGFFGITASYGQGTPAYERYRSRLTAYSARALPGLAVSSVLRTATTCEASSAAVLDGPPSVWGATDADGRPLWTQPIPSSNQSVCIGASDRFAENAYSPFAYDAVFAIAHALHTLIEGDGVEAIDGDALTDALLHEVSFDGVTGRVEFYGGSARRQRQQRRRRQRERRLSAYLGDRRVGISYTLSNFQEDSLVPVGAWTPCDTTHPSCAFPERFVHAPGATFVFSTADGERPAAVAKQPCDIQDHSVTFVSDCDASTGERTVRFDSPFGCTPREPLSVACHYVHPASAELSMSYVLFGLAAALKLYFLVQLYLWRQNKFVKRMQPVLSGIVLVGGILLDATTLLLPGAATPTRCVLRPTWAAVSFTVFFAPFGLKLCRVWLLIGRTMDDMAKEVSSPKRSPREVPNDRVSSKTSQVGSRGARQTRLILCLLALLAIHGAVLGSYFASTDAAQPRLFSRQYQVDWELLDPGATPVTLLSQPRVLELDDFVCPAWTAVVYTELGLQALLGVVTLAVAWKCRSVFSEFNESGVTLFAAMLIGLASLILFSLKKATALERRLEFVFEVVTITTTSSLVCLVAFGGKLLPCFRGQGAPASFEEWKRALGAAATGFVSQSSEVAASGRSRLASWRSSLASSAGSMGRMPSSDVEGFTSTVPSPERGNNAHSTAARGSTRRVPSSTSPTSGDVASRGSMSRAVRPSLVAAKSAVLTVAPQDIEVVADGSDAAAMTASIVDSALGQAPELPSSQQRLWVTFQLSFGAWMRADDGLDGAICDLITQEQAISTIETAQGAQGQGSPTRRRPGSLMQRNRPGSLMQRPPVGLAHAASSLSEASREKGGCGSDVAKHRHSVQSVGAKPSITGINVCLDGQSVDLPSPQAFRSLRPSDIINDPSRLLSLVREQQQDRHARREWLERELSLVSLEATES